MRVSKSVILLVNLGSPNKLSLFSIYRFLTKFLTDKRVIKLPKYIWYPILFGIILPLRGPKLLKKYKSIWHESGDSPLIYYTREQALSLNSLLQSQDIIVKYAFCYSKPEITDVLSEIHSEYQVNTLTVVPLYPQFSSTTTAAVFDQVARFYARKYYLPNIKFINNFYQDKNYINAIAAKVRDSWNSGTRGKILVLSYHSLPQVIIKNGDSYYEECLMTSELIAKKLNLDSNEYIVSFQSRFGSQKWLGPTTSDVLIGLAKQKFAIDIICPGFVSDCLETLEEIKEANCQLFFKNGGVKYNYIECLNLSDQFIQMLARL